MENNYQREQSAKILSCYVNSDDIIKGRKAAPIGSHSKDGTKVKTQNGWKVAEGKIIGGHALINGRYYKTRSFADIDTANEWLKNNTNHGVLHEQDGKIYVAHKDDKGFLPNDKKSVMRAHFITFEHDGKLYIPQGKSDAEHVKKRAKEEYNLDIEIGETQNNPNGHGLMTEIKF